MLEVETTKANERNEIVNLAQKIRVHSLKMTSTGGSSHIGACLSIADILAVLYSRCLRVDPREPRASHRDRFILSKGHAGAALYATLAEKGFFDPEILKTHYQNGSLLSGHVSHKGIPGVECSTGSLGHGLPIAAGLAYGARMRGSGHRIVVLLSDGECDEGSNWEAILFSAHHGLDNLTVIVDYNKIQSLGLVSETLALEPFADKWRSFGWNVIEADGHDHNEILQSLEKTAIHSGKPHCIIAHTTKGKGVSFMENSVLWHYRTAVGLEYDEALAELESR